METCWEQRDVAAPQGLWPLLDLPSSASPSFPSYTTVALPGTRNRQIQARPHQGLTLGLGLHHMQASAMPLHNIRATLNKSPTSSICL